MFPKGTKTGETELCQYFLRLGAPALKALNGKWKDADIIKAAKDDPAWKSFVRSIESEMPSSHLILSCPLLLLPSIPPSISICHEVMRPDAMILVF